MKKCLLFLVAVVVFASANTGVIAAESNFSTSQGWESLESKENSVVSQISETIVRFYENKDLGCGNDLGKTMDQAIHSFLQDKADTHQYVTKIYGTYKDNYKVSVTTLETTRTGNKGFFRFQVRTSFNYVGSPDVVSGDSTELTVVFDYDRGLIVDFYDPSNYYDMFVREPGLDSMFTERDLRPFTLNPDIEEKQRSLRNSIDETYDAEICGASASPDDSRSLMRSGPLFWQCSALCSKQLRPNASERRWFSPLLRFLANPWQLGLYQLRVSCLAGWRSKCI